MKTDFLVGNARDAALLLSSPYKRLGVRLSDSTLLRGKGRDSGLTSVGLGHAVVRIPRGQTVLRRADSLLDGSLHERNALRSESSLRLALLVDFTLHSVAPNDPHRKISSINA